MTRESGLDSASPLDFRKDIRSCHPGQKSVRIPDRGSLRFFLTHLTCARLASGVLSSGSKRWGHARVLNPGSVGPIILLFLLKDKAIFSESLRSDSYLSTFFKQKIDDDKIALFHELWAPRIIAFKGIKKAYLNVDGTNIDCEAEGVTLREIGYDKSGEGTTIVGVMYVIAPDGTPFTISNTVEAS